MRRWRFGWVRQPSVAEVTMAVSPPPPVQRPPDTHMAEMAPMDPDLMR